MKGSSLQNIEFRSFDEEEKINKLQFLFENSFQEAVDRFHIGSYIFCAGFVCAGFNFNMYRKYNLIQTFWCICWQKENWKKSLIVNQK